MRLKLLDNPLPLTGFQKYTIYFNVVALSNHTPAIESDQSFAQETGLLIMHCNLAQQVFTARLRRSDTLHV